MSFIQKIQRPEFWSNFVKVFLPFFILVCVIHLIMNSARDIFAGDFEKVNEVNFANGLWMRFFGIKVVICSLYALWMTNKNMK